MWRNSLSLFTCASNVFCGPLLLVGCCARLCHQFVLLCWRTRSEGWRKLKRTFNESEDREETGWDADLSLICIDHQYVGFIKGRQVKWGEQGNKSISFKKTVTQGFCRHSGGVTRCRRRRRRLVHCRNFNSRRGKDNTCKYIVKITAPHREK